MKTEKSILSCFLFLALLFSGVALYAQQGQGGPPPGGPPTAEQELQRYDKALKLTDDQKTQILTILKKRHEDFEAARENNTDRSAMRTIFENSDKEIRALLTEPQQKIFDQMRRPGSARPGSNGEGDGNEPPPPPPDGNGNGPQL